MSPELEINMMVKGWKALSDTEVELELQELITVKQKPDLIEYAVSGNAAALMKAIAQENPYSYKVKIPMEWSKDKRVLPLCGMKLTLDTSKNHKRRTGTR